jgi:hypothetical protein
MAEYCSSEVGVGGIARASLPGAIKVKVCSPSLFHYGGAGLNRALAQSNFEDAIKGFGS